MRTAMALHSAILLLGIGTLAAGKKMKVQDLPAAVRQTVTEQTTNATLVGLTKEVEKGKTVFELETRKPNGQTRDLMIDTTGAVLSVEEEVALDSLPAPAKAAIEKSAAGGKIIKLETLAEGKEITYEAAIVKKGKKSSITVRANGTQVK